MEEGKEITEKKGEHNMCKVIEDMLNDSMEAGKEIGKEIGRQEGEIIGAIKAYKDVGMSKDEVANKVINKFQFAEDEAKSYVEKYWL